MYQYTEFDKQFVRARAAQYRDQLERNMAGQGVIQHEAVHHFLRVHTCGNHVCIKAVRMGALFVAFLQVGDRSGEYIWHR